MGASFPSFLSKGRGHLGILCPGWEINPLLIPKLGSQWLNYSTSVWRVSTMCQAYANMGGR